MSSQPVFFEWVAGKVANIFVSALDSSSSVNLKKGIVGFLQLQDAEGTVTEVRCTSIIFIFSLLFCTHSLYSVYLELSINLLSLVF